MQDDWRRTWYWYSVGILSAKMDVWRRRPGATLSWLTPVTPPPARDAGVAARGAAALVLEINVLLSVANHSTDFHTKTVRLAGAKQKLADLQALVVAYPVIRLTSLAEVQADIARIESDLIDCRLKHESDGAIWVFHAGLFLGTPLSELHCHGLVEKGPYSCLPSLAAPGSRSGWQLCLPTFREMGIDLDEMPPSVVISDVGPIPEHGEPFLSYLLTFRSIIESGLALNEIESELIMFSGRDEFAATVFERLGPGKLMMRRAGIL